MICPERISEPVRVTPIFAECDVLVVGGGPAGIAAATSSARNGARTILVEAYGFLGGMLTAGMVNVINGFRSQRHRHCPRAVGGVAQELVERIAQHDGAYLPDGYVPYCVVVDPEVAKIAAFELVRQSGARMLLHTIATNALREAGSISGIVTHSKSGRRAIRAKVVVDCTGDGDIASNAGAAYEVGRSIDGKTLPMQLMFRMRAVDCGRLASYAYSNRARLQPMYDIEPLDHVIEAAELGRPFGVSGLGLGEGENSGTFSCIVWRGRALVWASRQHELKGIDVEDLTVAEIESRLDLPAIVSKIKNVPGFERAELEQTAAQVGVRETRRIVGDYTLTEKDVIDRGEFEDSVAVGANPMACLGRRPILAHDGFEIPFRCLLPEKVDGVLLAGRCISASHEAHGSIRAMATCMATGQAAGTAAALCVMTGEIPRHVSVPRLQALLQAQGAIVRRP